MIARLLVAALAPFAPQDPVPPPAAPPALPPPASAADQGEVQGIVRTVRFEGDTRLTQEALALQVRTKAGVAWSKRTADEDLKMLAARFQVWGDVRAFPLQGGLVDVVFHIEQLPSVSRVLFRGNSELDEEDLREALHLSDNNSLPFSTVRGSGLAVLVRQLEEKYQEEGYLFAEIEPRIEKQGDENVLQFEILEGPEVSVDEVDFVGLEQFTARNLRDLMKTSRSFWFFTQTYKRKDLHDDIVAIEQFLRDEGYLDARVAVESVLPDRDAEEVDITIRIDQGPRYVVREVKLSGLNRFTEAELRPMIRMVPGMPYRQTVYRKDRSRILEHIRHFGYVRASIRERPIEGYVAGAVAQVDVTYAIVEDEPKRVRDVRVVGNENTKDAVIRRELDLYPGDLFDGQAMLDAEDRLRATGFFIDQRGVPLAWVENEQTDDIRYEDVVMKVEDGTAGLFTIFGGLASGQGFFLGTDLTIDNFDITDPPSSPATFFEEFLDQRAFHGAGQKLRLRANPGNEFSNYLVQFTEPYLTGPVANPFFLDTDFHLREYTPRYYDEKTIGGQVTIGKRLSRKQAISAGLRQDKTTIDNVLDRPDPIEDLLAWEGSTLVRAFVADWEYRDFDSLRNPTEGFRVGLGGECMGGPLGAELDAWKATASAEVLIPVYENEEEQRHVIGVVGALGEVRPYGDSDDIPIFERFYAGGPGGFLPARGFEFRGIGPHDGSFPEGGEAGWAVSTEYVFPLVDMYEARLRENTPFLRGVLFVDQAMLEETWGQLEEGRWRMSAGVGLRLKIPFQLFSAPLELYYGIPIQRARDDERESFQINFSTRF